MSNFCNEWGCPYNNDGNCARPTEDCPPTNEIKTLEEITLMSEKEKNNFYKF
jgi:hypothetical protein